MKDISKYCAFFHDGSIIDIKHGKNNIILSMESAEINKTDVDDDIVLSQDARIRGKLHIEKIKKIETKGTTFPKKMTYDDGNIFDFTVTQNSASLSIEWVNFPPKSEVNDFSVIKVEAENVYWENIPTLLEKS